MAKFKDLRIRKMDPCRRRPPWEGSIAEPPVEGRPEQGKRELRLHDPAPRSVGGWIRMPVRAPVTEPENHLRMARRENIGCQVPASSEARPRIGESGVGSNAGPICFARPFAWRASSHPPAAFPGHPFLPRFLLDRCHFERESTPFSPPPHGHLDTVTPCRKALFSHPASRNHDESWQEWGGRPPR